MSIGEGIESKSRGLIVLFPEPVNPKAEQVLLNHGLEMVGHTTKQFRSHEVDETTLVLTMTERQKKKVMEDYYISHNIYTIKEFVGEFGDVVDPYGGTMLQYEECYEELARLVKKTVYQIIKEA
jgi:protein-tyrosine-phosphatase